MKYSVLLPTRNGGDFLENCIGTILDQSYDDMELVVSDNANTDNTQDVLSSISDPRLKVIRAEEPVSVTENWNLALNASSGDYILMMGDDDCLLPGYFEKIDRVLEKYDYPDCITCNGYSYIDAGSINGNVKNYYKDPFYQFGPEFHEGFLSDEMRLNIVEDMFRFKVRLPLNMQPHLVSRRAKGYIEGDLFRKGGKIYSQVSRLEWLFWAALGYIISLPLSLFEEKKLNGSTYTAVFRKELLTAHK